MVDLAHHEPVTTPYAATLELRAPGALSLRVEVVDGAPQIVVTVRALSAWLEARGALGKRPLTAVITTQGDAFGEAAQGDRGVLTGDQAVMVTAAVGGAALRLIPDVLASVRDGEAAAQKALRDLVGRVKASAGLAPAAPVPPSPQNLSEHMAAERASMVEALEATRWDRGAAAERMGMSRRTFYRRMTEYGLLEGAKPRGIKAQRLRQQAAEKGKAAPARRPK
jgi:hypothetical protein